MALTHGAEWRIYEYVNWVNIGSDNGMSPGRRHAIIRTDSGILWIGPLGTNLSEMLIEKSYILIHETAFENFVWKIADISSRP